jgi:hypothetical protein
MVWRVLITVVFICVPRFPSRSQCFPRGRCCTMYTGLDLLRQLSPDGPFLLLSFSCLLPPSSSFFVPPRLVSFTSYAVTSYGHRYIRPQIYILYIRYVIYTVCSMVTNPCRIRYGHTVHTGVSYSPVAPVRSACEVRGPPTTDMFPCCGVYFFLLHPPLHPPV